MELETSIDRNAKTHFDLITPQSPSPQRPPIWKRLPRPILFGIFYVWTFYCVFSTTSSSTVSFWKYLDSRLHFWHNDVPPQDGPSPQDEVSVTAWEDIVPSEQLNWQPCLAIYGPRFVCARLTVPMDYNRPLNESAANPKVHLALVLLPGANRTDDPFSFAEAPLIFNPGGPGGAGTMFMGLRGQALQTYVGEQNDLIGFDPRGVGFSTPKADCFASPLGKTDAFVNRLAWTATGHDVGGVNSTPVALGKLDARARALAKLCKRVDDLEGDDSIFRHSSTPFHARDMLSIVHAWDEWRDNGKARLAQLDATSDQVSETDHAKATHSLKGKLVYWGFSYGTMLGATFASMFPDKVGRMVLDGIVHPDKYVNPMWETGIIDADAIFDLFFDYCAEAGSSCVFYRPGDTSDDVRERLDHLLGELEQQPLVILPPQVNIPVLLTASDVKKLLFFGGLYSPLTGFPVIAAVLQDIISGHGENLVNAPSLISLCSSIELPVWPDDAMKAIACSDKRHKLNATVEDLRKHFNEMAPLSWFTDVWFAVDPALGCNGWEVDSKGPPMRWGDHPEQKPELIETNFPILVLQNTLDPVTPLRHAIEVTKKFANASIVEQDGIGHCTLSCVSSCTLTHLRAYINKGVVPPTPNFDDEDEYKGKWPKCTCHEKPWGLGHTEESESGVVEISSGQREAQEELRAQFSALMMEHHLEDHPLKETLLSRMEKETVSFRQWEIDRAEARRETLGFLNSWA
ncbi:Alpha/Beta hydrolase protein [Xylariaceae sp. FL1019]|nr:Alpha/Beta hydrolase protein [Xylariaceae sp. FL1019]